MVLLRYQDKEECKTKKILPFLTWVVVVFKRLTQPRGSGFNSSPLLFSLELVMWHHRIQKIYELVNFLGHR